MKITKSLLTKNDCYKSGQQINVKGLMIHSVGCAQPKASVFVSAWDKPGYQVCVHAFIDGNSGEVFQTLPWNWRGWHCGGAGNNTHIGVEMCEPATIAYSGGANWTDKDPAVTKAVVMRTYQSATELFAKLCKDFELDPMADGVIISHREGCARGIASNHADVEHLWSKFDLTMDKFRSDIKAAMSPKSEVADWAADAWKWGIDSGLCDGTRPTDPLTRQEAVTMFYRLKNLNF